MTESSLSCRELSCRKLLGGGDDKGRLEALGDGAVGRQKTVLCKKSRWSHSDHTPHAEMASSSD